MKENFSFFPNKTITVWVPFCFQERLSNVRLLPQRRGTSFNITNALKRKKIVIFTAICMYL